MESGKEGGRMFWWKCAQERNPSLSSFHSTFFSYPEFPPLSFLLSTGAHHQKMGFIWATSCFFSPIYSPSISLLLLQNIVPSPPPFSLPFFLPNQRCISLRGLSVHDYGLQLLSGFPTERYREYYSLSFSKLVRLVSHFSGRFDIHL